MMLLEKIACLKSVWLSCMYDRKIDYSWRTESWRDEKRKKKGNHEAEKPKSAWDGDACNQVN